MKTDGVEIIVTLRVDYPCDLTKDEIEKDLRKGEGELGFEYNYSIKDVKVLSNDGR